MINDPVAHDRLYDWSIKEFGLNWNIVESYYLFLECIGFNRKERLTLTEDLKHVGCNDNLKEKFQKIDGSVLRQLHSLYEYFKERLAQYRLKYMNKSYQEKSNEINECCFGGIIRQFTEEFDIFVQVVGIYLTWDIFCEISCNNFSIKNIRKAQLDYWLTNRKEGLTLPLAKIVDDLSAPPKEKNIVFYNNKDMVDAEMFTYVFFGQVLAPNEIKSIIALTYDNPDTTRKRKNFMLNNIIKFEKERNQQLPKKAGKIYCLSKEDQTIIDIIDISFPIAL
jgi:hypothetical protein